MRRVFLWAARNQWLKEHLPQMRFMRRAVRRFMPGETLDDALSAAVPLERLGITTMYTRLGENLESLAEADGVADHYIEVLDRIKASGMKGEISVKPTQLGLDHDADVCLAHLVRLAEHAAATGSYLWVDMEGSAYTEATIVLYERLRARRSPRPGSASRRTCAGRRPTSSDCCRSIRRSAWSRAPTTSPSRSRSGARAPSIRAMRAWRSGSCSTGAAGRSSWVSGRTTWGSSSRSPSRSGQAGVGRDGYEVQMLYGIREDQQKRLLKDGYKVRSLIAYGEHWYPWYMRRLAERPANVWFALRQILPF